MAWFVTALHMFGLSGSKPLSRKVEATADEVRTERATGDKDVVRPTEPVVPKTGSTSPDHGLEGTAGRWRREVFGSEPKAGLAAPAIDVKTLHAKIGELTVTNDFLSGALGKAGLLSAKR